MIEQARNEAECKQARGNEQGSQVPYVALSKMEVESLVDFITSRVITEESDAVLKRLEAIL